MSKALLGTHVAPTSLKLLDEVRALRQRVAELEAALAAAEGAAARSGSVPTGDAGELVEQSARDEPATAPA